MGTDINLHIEVKINDTWHHYGQYRPDRDYQLFGIMAGVRGDGPPIVPPRGLPDDATFMTVYHAEMYGNNDYGHSWFGHGEIQELEDEYENRPRKYKFFEEWVGVHLYGNCFILDEAPTDVTDIRFVFWFD